jgi:hypothetical protein
MIEDPRADWSEDFVYSADMLLGCHVWKKHRQAGLSARATAESQHLCWNGGSSPNLLEGTEKPGSTGESCPVYMAQYVQQMEVVNTPSIALTVIERCKRIERNLI